MGATKSETLYLRAVNAVYLVLKETSLVINEIWLKDEIKGLVLNKRKLGFQLVFLLTGKTRL